MREAGEFTCCLEIRKACEEVRDLTWADTFCVKGEPCVEWDEIDEKSVTSPDAGVLV